MSEAFTRVVVDEYAVREEGCKDWDVCEAGAIDGVCCPEGECDLASGVRERSRLKPSPVMMEERAQAAESESAALRTRLEEVERERDAIQLDRDTKVRDAWNELAEVKAERDRAKTLVEEAGHAALQRIKEGRGC